MGHATVRSWGTAWRAARNACAHYRDCASIEGCIGCGCLSLQACALRNPDDALASRGPGASLLERGQEE